ncbi:hypothetical protein [Sphingobium agri]|uniref:Uncharacterized protein n=1 Tax=Sphingobium agri TaxID=2933566 RepID=A0ABT0E2N8_9SPHN|nr:hypothetical protein [Sphingobium agri]MCK0533427.1 hypothetical protein [Sphingobium agri]
MAEPAFLTVKQLRSLPEYSTSLPTGTAPGKQWRRAARPWHTTPSADWWLGEYGEPYPEGHEHHGQIPIYWRQIVVTDAPREWPRHVRVPLRMLTR